jgi:hypothetical protein
LINSIPGAFYHVTSRENERKAVFTNKEERIMPKEKVRPRNIVSASVFAHNGTISKAESMLRNMGVITLGKLGSDQGRTL